MAATLQEQSQQDHALWVRFTSQRSTSNRDQLVTHYSAFANMHAAKLFANRQIKEIEFEEFKQYALVGLIEAIDRYDAASDASFRTYASHRIKGAILDGIEKYCEKQQQISLRSRLRKERIQSMLRTASETQEVTFDSLVEVSIGIAIGYMLEDSGMYQQEETAYEHNVYKSRELADLVRAMKDLVSKLPEQEEAIIKLHYFQHVQFDQIAESMQMTKGRVSQIHQRALRRLQEHYDQLKLLRTDY